MPKEWVDIADTAVKIGLGALISGTAAWLLSKERNRHERNRELLKRKLDNLETVAKEVTEYLKAFTGLIAKIDGIVRGIEIYKKKEPLNYLDLIQSADDSFVSARQQYAHSKTKLLLFGSVKTSKAIDSFKELEEKVREQVIFKKELPTLDEIEQWRKQIEVNREKFFAELRNVYSA